MIYASQNTTPKAGYDLFSSMNIKIGTVVVNIVNAIRVKNISVVTDLGFPEDSVTRILGHAKSVIVSDGGHLCGIF